jgi:hypothetical protein
VSVLEISLGLVLAAVDLWAVARTATARASAGTRIVWILLILLLPGLGFLLWLLLGPRGRRAYQ